MEVVRKMSTTMLGADFKETELCLGLPGGGGAEAETIKATGKRGFSETVDLKLNLQSKDSVADLNDNGKCSAKDNNNHLPCTKDPAKPPAKYVITSIFISCMLLLNIIGSYLQSY